MQDHPEPTGSLFACDIWCADSCLPDSNMPEIDKCKSDS